MDLNLKNIIELGVNRNNENLNKIKSLFGNIENLDLSLEGELTSSLCRYNREFDIKNIIDDIIKVNKFKSKDVIYQIYRLCLLNHKDDYFKKLSKDLEYKHNDEMMDRMYKNKFYKNKIETECTNFNLVLHGDCENELSSLEDDSVDLVVTSPPYYNAREYVSYKSYDDYLIKMKRIFSKVYDKLKDGRYVCINVSPVISKRQGRHFESIRHPIHFDFHQFLKEIGYDFIDEIIWIKPEHAVKNRVATFNKNRLPLTYKPNTITESILIYRKSTGVLTDDLIKHKRLDYERFDGDIERTNCWYISPKHDKNHPAVYPKELVEKLVKYYSFENDVVLDPFGGSGTTGIVSKNMKRKYILIEQNDDYVELIKRNLNEI